VASTSANKKKPRYNWKLPIAHNTMCKSISEPHRRKIAVSDVEGRRDELVVVLLRFVAEERTGYTIRDVTLNGPPQQRTLMGRAIYWASVDPGRICRASKSNA
jgi:hypothetical protein